MKKHKFRNLRKRLLAFGLAAVMMAGGTISSIPSYASDSFFGEYDESEFFEDDTVIDDTGESGSEFFDDTDNSEDGFFDDGASDDVIVDDTQDENEEIIIDDTDETDTEDSEIIIGGNTEPSDLEISLDDAEDESAVLDDTVYLEASADGVTVTVNGTVETMNGAEELSVTKVSQAKIRNYEAAMNESAPEEETTEVLTVLDITLLDAEGNEVEPLDSVSVLFSGQKIMENSADSRTLTAVHVVEDTGITGSRATETSFEELDTQVSAETLSFETDSFSEYALVLTGNDSQKETDFGGEQYFELDKYLSNPTGTMNGQDTYDVYLEQAYYDGTEPHLVENYAPPGQDIILVLDQSASMSGRIDGVNDSVESMLNQLKTLNNTRLQNAKNGLYTDIDPNGDVEAQMSDHYMRITGIIGYNNRVYEKYHNPSGKDVLTDMDVYDLTNAAHINDDYAEWVRTQDPSCELQDCTRTDLGIARAKSWINEENYENTHIVLVTDGSPYGYGPEGSVTYEYESNEYGMMSAQNSNDALRDAREMKDNGATIYAVYFDYNDTEELAAAFSTGDIYRVPIPSNHITAIFLSLLSSDYPLNGGLGYTSTPSGKCTYPFTYTYTFTRTSQDRFGKYIYFPENVDDLLQNIESIPGRIEGEGSQNMRGYAGPTSYVYDEITDPFQIMDVTNIRVYQVPRIPVNLDADGVPTDMDDDGIVQEFRWGEQYVENEDGDVTTEWIEITNDPSISVTVQNNIVKVTGYDYELNAVTDYDKDLYAQWPSGNAREYEPGDYGYKLIVVIPVNAKVTFGGNGIETNNSDTSAFYPSEPTGYQSDDPDGEDYLPRWEDNTDLNPDGNSFIEKYPVPYVDLDINYKIPSDDILIYAPQTAKLENLVTDENNNMWYVDPAYSSLQTIRDNAYDAYVNASTAYNDAMRASADDPENQELLTAVAEALADYNEAKTTYDEAQAAFETVEAYIPDGINNAYVDISYQLKDPDGIVVGTLTIPHGTPYIITDGESNLKWNFTDGEDAEITKSGVYKIECTVTPVTTVRAPGGHVATPADTEEVQDSVGYISTEYSSTGSSASGSQSAEVITADADARIFQLHITGVDSRLQKNQALDFNQGNENLRSTTNVHIGSWEWVCTDGVTESLEENEPGVTGSLMVGGEVIVTSQIPVQAENENLVTDVMGTTVVNVDDGEYVPVSVLLSRNTGNLNKSASDQDQVTQTLVYMTDSDNLYGSYSSVVWDHECTIIEECTESDFADAQDYNTSENASGRGKVRYLIHVMDNPVPDVSKETSTPGISRGEDIVWTIQLDNDDAAKNPNRRSAVSSMVDILPYVGDGRIDPNTNIEGSQFSGTLQYKSISVDYSGSASALERFRDGTDKLYYTTETAVRSADEAQLLGTAASGNITWHELTGTVNGTTVTFTGCPENATAIRLETTIGWGENVTVNLTANLTDLSVQESGDHYHNDAYVMNGNGITISEVAVTTVTNLYVSGTVWEDEDFNGLMASNEYKVDNVVVTLYQPYNSANGGSPDRTINGVQLTRAYNTDGDKFGQILTPADGSYLFDDIPAGTYYVVVDMVPDKYEVTQKQAGAGDANSSAIDSEAEEEILPANTEAEQSLAKSVWIKEITVSGEGVPNQNIGLKNIQGSISIGKTLDEIYYPSSMTEEEKEGYNVTFLFRLRNTDTNEVFTESITLDADTIRPYNGRPQVWATFDDLDIGTYELTEVSNAQYTISEVNSSSDNVKYNSSSGVITVPVTSGEYDFEIEVDNTLEKDPPGGGESNTSNWLNMRVPVSLEVIYVGADPISDQSAVSYTFTRNDFHPRQNGDIIVTYDDGTTISLSEGTLDFSQLTFSPATVYNTMNSGNDKIPVTVYYSEKGKTVSDSFRVGVDLKPIHKFQINFDANGSTFADGSTRNSVMFGYDESTASNFVTSGVYKDVANGGLNGRGSSYTFAGWNTRPDGLGVQYSDFTALNAIGLETQVSVLTLYAVWQVKVTFDANSGVLAGGITDSEKAIVGRASGDIIYNVNQTASTGLVGSKSGYIFLEWNTSLDGKGISLNDYGEIKSPITFYAIYYKTDYYPSNELQTFMAPYSGTYQIQCWGGSGADCHYGARTAYGGRGGYVSGELYLNKGDTLYVWVGTGGGDVYYNNNPGWAIVNGYGGGSADVRVSESLYSRLLVAGGGGSGAIYGPNQRNGGIGGGLTGGNGQQMTWDANNGAFNAAAPTGGTQTSGGAGYGDTGRSGGFGYRGNPCGGDGWYGGGHSGITNNVYSGAGGSSYCSGYPLCTNSVTGITLENAQLLSGNDSIISPNGNRETGHSGEAHARIVCIEQN